MCITTSFAAAAAAALAPDSANPRNFLSKSTASTYLLTLNKFVEVEEVEEEDEEEEELVFDDDIVIPEQTKKSDTV